MRVGIFGRGEGRQEDNARVKNSQKEERATQRRKAQKKRRYRQQGSLLKGGLLEELVMERGEKKKNEEAGDREHLKPMSPSPERRALRRGSAKVNTRVQVYAFREQMN